MAITTLDGVLAGMQYQRSFVKATVATSPAGRQVSMFYQAGHPGAAVAPTPGVAGAALTSYAGQLPFSNPVSGNSYLARFQGSVNNSGTLILADRLWHNSGLSMTLTTAQTVDSVAWPARDALGTTDGNQVLIGVEISTVAGAGTPTLSMSYTNDAGTAGQTGTGILVGGTATTVGSFYQMALAPGDTGVRSIQTFTLSASWTSGAMHLVAYREIARLDIAATNLSAAVDALTAGFPRLFDNTVPFLMLIPAGSGGAIASGHMIVTQG